MSKFFDSCWSYGLKLVKTFEILVLLAIPQQNCNLAVAIISRTVDTQLDILLTKLYLPKKIMHKNTNDSNIMLECVKSLFEMVF